MADSHRKRLRALATRIRTYSESSSIGHKDCRAGERMEASFEQAGVKLTISQTGSFEDGWDKNGWLVEITHSVNGETELVGEYAPPRCGWERRIFTEQAEKVRPKPKSAYKDRLAVFEQMVADGVER